MSNIAVLNPVKSPGIAMIDCPQGAFQYELPTLWSPDTELAKNCVLDLAPPLYDPGSKGIIFDRSGKNKHGAITGAVWKKLPSGLWYLDFDETDDDIKVTNFSLAASPSTYIAWIKDVTGAVGTHRLFDFTSGVTYRNVSLGANGVLNTYGGGDVVTGTAQLRDAGWKMVAIVHQTNNCLFYVNGASDAVSSGSTFTLSAITATLAIGNTAAAGPTDFKGSIALAQIYNRVLSALEIANLFNQTRRLFGV